jgi:hypothetical protein
MLLRVSVGSCEYGNEPLGSVKREKFLDCLSDYQLHKKDTIHGVS